MDILVTGGAGYIGSHITEYLLAGGHSVTVLDNFSRGTLQNLQAVIRHPRFTLIEGDTQDGALVSQLVAQNDMVYHLAAIVGVKHYVENPLHVMESNVYGTQNVLRSAFKSKIKILFASTSEIYGKNGSVPYTEDSDRVLGPTSIDRWSYSTSKALDEHICFAYHRMGLPITVVRYFNSYGPRADTSEYGGVAIRFILQALKGEPITVFHDGAQSRSFTYISDTVRGTVLAANSQKGNGQVYNIGNRRETKIITLAKTVKKLCESKSEIQFIPYENFYGKHYEDIPRRTPDISKAKKDLRWKPAIKLEAGIRQCIDYYRSEMATQRKGRG